VIGQNAKADWPWNVIRRESPHDEIREIQKMNEIKISVVIPTHKRPWFLERALKSIHGQRGNFVQIIVVSDILDPETHAVAHQWLTDQDVFVRRSGESGPAESRNIGLQQAVGDYVIFLDDDDEICENSLKDLIQTSSFKENKLFRANGIRAVESRPNGVGLLISKEFAPYGLALNEEFYVRNQIPLSCVCVPLLLAKSMTFDHHMTAYEDWDYLMRLFIREWPQYEELALATIYVVPDDTTDRRGQSVNAQNENAILDYLYAYKRTRAINENIANKRAELINTFGFPVQSWQL
jgi:GalNAc5-diNAcBac-PP-undecaprenol beta-1,3-glucosyltransferase